MQWYLCRYCGNWYKRDWLWNIEKYGFTFVRWGPIQHSTSGLSQYGWNHLNLNLRSNVHAKAVLKVNLVWLLRRCRFLNWMTRCECFISNYILQRYQGRLTWMNDSNFTQSYDIGGTASGLSFFLQTIIPSYTRPLITRETPKEIKEMHFKHRHLQVILAEPDKTTKSIVERSAYCLQRS